MAFDMIFEGIDSDCTDSLATNNHNLQHQTSSALSGIMYCVAENPDKQKTLREELTGIQLDKNTRLTSENMKNLSYRRAAMKEGMRLLPAEMEKCDGDASHQDSKSPRT